MKIVLNYIIIVKGRVQGVGYRAFTFKLAKSLGLVGYVKNMPDGTVKIEAEGTKENLDRFAVLCEKGPGWAYVEKIILIESPVQGYRDFKIR